MNKQLIKKKRKCTQCVFCRGGVRCWGVVGNKISQVELIWLEVAAIAWYFPISYLLFLPEGFKLEL